LRHHTHRSECRYNAVKPFKNNVQTTTYDRRERGLKIRFILPSPSELAEIGAPLPLVFLRGPALITISEHVVAWRD
jgi:hypothetical protein